MLPPLLAALMERLGDKGAHSRTTYEDAILDELKAVDDDLDERDALESAKAAERYGHFTPGITGPHPGTRCVLCGR